MRSVVVVPTFNERDNIDLLLTELLALPSDLSVIVVDDNSPDGTGALADDWAARDSRISVIHRAGKLGLGTAYVAGFKRALEQGFDRILTMDADFSHAPRYIPSLIALSAKRDLVIGSRYVDGGGAVGCSWHRLLLSRGANSIAKLMLGLRATDCTAGFRCYQAGVLDAIGIDDILSNGYSFLVEMLYRVQRAGYRVGEVPIVFEDRQRGTSKISKQEVYRAMFTVGRLSSERLSDKLTGKAHS